MFPVISHTDCSRLSDSFSERGILNALPHVCVVFTGSSLASPRVDQVLFVCPDVLYILVLWYIVFHREHSSNGWYPRLPRPRFFQRIDTHAVSHSVISHAFPVATSWIWNILPLLIWSVIVIKAFWWELETFLYIIDHKVNLAVCVLASRHERAGQLHLFHSQALYVKCPGCSIIERHSYQCIITVCTVVQSRAVVRIVWISVGNDTFGLLLLKNPLTNWHTIWQRWLCWGAIQYPKWHVSRFRGMTPTKWWHVNGLFDR